MSRAPIVTLEFTPNPDTLKYVVVQPLLPSGAANYTSKELAQGSSPLAEKLFTLANDISGVMIGKTFVTVTLSDQEKLHALNDMIIATIQDFITSGETAVTNLPASGPTKELNEVEKKIVAILDKEIRPAVAMDGGDICFEKFEDGVVYLSMQGSCSGCPSSLMTLKMGVETRLKDSIPEVQEVIPV